MKEQDKVADFIEENDLDQALEKYNLRINEKGSPTSE